LAKNWQQSSVRKLFDRLKSEQFARFLLAGGTAAAANFLSRIFFSQFVNFEAAVLLAFCVGLSVGFFLNKTYVFWGSSQHVAAEIFYYILVNLFALLQTWLLSLYLAQALQAELGTELAEAVAHLAGIMLPVFSSFLGHRYITFRGASRS
jgi:putative flippase GtrA